jgi:hypothetical protein
MTAGVEHLPPVMEQISPGRVVLTLTPEAATMLAVLLSHVQLNCLRACGLPLPSQLCDNAQWMALNDAGAFKVQAFVKAGGVASWMAAASTTIALTNPA